MEFPTALGGERSFLSIADRLRDQFEFLILSPDYGSLAQEIQHSGLKHIPFHLREASGERRSDQSLCAELQQVLSQSNCQLLHANSVTLARFLGRMLPEFRLPVTGHLRDIMQLSQKAIGDLQQLNALIAVSQATAACYVEQGLPREKISVIYNGIDPRPFSEPPGFTLSKELHVPGDHHFAAVIGQICLRKGQDVFFEALKTLAPQFPDWHYLILGERYSTKQESRDFVAKLELLVEQAHMQEQVHWLGYINDVPTILQQCELLIHPARQEPFGRVLLEAAAAGVPILSTRVGGTEEMLVHEQSAWLVPAGDPVAIAKGCQRLMADPQLRQALGREAQTQVLARFSLEQSAHAHADFWNTLLRSR